MKTSALLAALFLLSTSPACVTSVEGGGDDPGKDGGVDDDPDPGADGGDGPVSPGIVQLEGTATTADCYRSPAAESPAKLVDGDDATKFLAFNNSAWIRYDAGAPYVLSSYALTSANDSPERDPRGWILSGSNDGKRWTRIDVRAGEDFAARFERREFEVATTDFYRYYHLRMENESGGVLQLAELELFGETALAAPAETAPAAPGQLVATAVARDQINLSWSDDSDDEALFRIEGSIDGQLFAPAGYAPANTTTFAVTRLPPDAQRSYRVVAVNAAGESAPSAVGSARTLAPISRTTNGDGTVTYVDGAYSVTVAAQGQGIATSMIENMVDEYFTVYPAMSAEYNPGATRDLTITFDPNYEGVAYAVFGTGDVTISSVWARGAPNDIDVIAHEGFHIIQAYQNGNTPGWATEGLADFARYHHGTYDSEQCWSVQRYEPGQNYTDAYGVTARFLLWLEAKVDPDIATALDDTLRAGQYSDAFWTQRTGKSVDALWADYAANPAPEPVDYQ